MALLTDKESQTLASWSFIKDYNRHRVRLIEVAKMVYSTLVTCLGSPPTAAECEEPLITALFVSGTFGNILKSKAHARPTLYGLFTQAMTRYILDTDWTEITRP